MKQYKSAPDADRIAASLLCTVHSDIAEFPVRCIFQDENDLKGNHIVLANVRKVSGLQAFLSGTCPVEGLQEVLELDMNIEFVEPNDLILIVIGYPSWVGLDDKQREALIDHELCHVRTSFNERTGKATAKIIGHDVEEFYGVIQRHGDWKGEIKGFGPNPALKVTGKSSAATG